MQERYDCQLITAWISPTPVFYSLAFPKDSPLTAFFSLALLRLVEEGTVAASSRRYLPSDTYGDSTKKP